MNNKVTLCENALEPSTWTTHENVGDVRDFLVGHFGIWPNTAHIYLDHVANNADITPHDEAGVERLGKVNGHFFVVIYPEGIELILLVVALVVAAVAISLVFLFRPNLKKNQNEESANNELAGRQNQARPNERIPDIYGQLWATFDLLAVPYRTFQNNVEIEHCYMCVGRGDYLINSTDVRDDITPIDQIEGTSVAIYGPNKSPNRVTDVPTVQIGPAINEKVVNLQVFDSVNGQILRAPNLGTVLGNSNIRFQSPNIIHTNDASIDFTQHFALGDVLTVGGLNANDALAVDSGGIQPSVDLSVQAPISGLTASTITLANPASLNSNWSALAAFAGGVSTYASIDLIANGAFTVPQRTATIAGFVIINPSMSGFWCNFVAPQGMYVIDKQGKQYGWGANIRVFVQQCDINGTPISTVQSYVVAVSGNATDRQPKGSTLKIVIAPQVGFGGIIVYAKRTTGTALASGNTVVDEVQWRDAYIVSDVSQLDFGNVTTVQTKTIPTLSALAIKERKLNALVTRKLPQWTGSGTTFSAPVATKNAADIICAMALDSFIGDRVVSELDLVNIYGTVGPGGTVETYFNANPQLTEFCYTFDDSKISFEESLSDVAQAVFCVAYRRGSVLSLSFEKASTNSILLYNHRNKVPKSETRTVTFGSIDDNDGINLDYIEPNAPNYPNLDTTVTLYFPANQSAKNPKKFTAIGVRNIAQALTLGWRLYNKILYQNTVVEFESTEESALLVLQDRVLVADNTRADTQDGEILDQTSLLLTLSQPVVFDGVSTYSIWLQNADGFVENIDITPGPVANQVVLATAPTNPCVFDDDGFAKTTYMIVANVPAVATAFLLTEKSPKDGKLYSVKAVNYAPEYYQNDVTASVPGGGITGLPPFVVFMPTTRGRIFHDPTGQPSYGTSTVGADTGEIDQWTSRSLSYFNDSLVWDYSPPGPYAAPGADAIGSLPRSQITGIYGVMVAQELNTNWFDQLGISGNGGSSFGLLGSADGTAQAYYHDLLGGGDPTTFDFTQVQFRAAISTSLNIDLTPPGNQFLIDVVGIFILFNGATLPAGFGAGGSTLPSTGYILHPSNPLYQIDPTTIGMVQTDCLYTPSALDVIFNARTFAIPDPGVTAVLYYVIITDFNHVGDASGLLTSRIDINPGDFTIGEVTIGPILAIHGSSSLGGGAGSGSSGGTGGTPGTGGSNAGSTLRFSLGPTTSGNFSFAHGLGVVPLEVRIGNTSDGSIRFQPAPSPPWDITNVYLNSSDNNLTAFLEIDV